MSQTLITGSSGLLSHQRMLDVVANNLANLNTTAFKSQRVHFADMLYTTHKPAASGSSAIVGGTNPIQTGFGVSVAQTSRNHGQGVLNSTGSAFDFSIQGDGFFVVSDGVPSYTRAGSFSLDNRGFLVDPATGAYVQRYGSVGEGLDGGPAYQSPSDKAIRVPLGAGVAGKATTKAAFLGNLPANATPPLAQEMSSFKPMLTGGVPAIRGTLLNNLDTNTGPYTVSDQLVLEGFNFNGDPINSTLPVDATTTVGDVIDFYNSILVGATADVNSAGRIAVTASSPGPTQLQLELLDHGNNSGGTEFADHALLTETLGKLGDISETTMQIFDTRGETHTLSVEFQKIDNNTWNTKFNLIDGSGTAIDGLVQQLTFAEDGKFLSVRGTGEGDAKIELRFDSLSDDQPIEISLENFTHLATTFTSSFEQDGFPPGSLVSISANAEGILEGVASNGQRIPVAQLAIASFVNVQGLEANGQNYYVETSNSGQPQLGGGLAGANGFVRAGQLEQSNVDVALEFTQLIVAQRGFSANARTITVASEVLQELANIVR